MPGLLCVCNAVCDARAGAGVAAEEPITVIDM